MSFVEGLSLDQLVAFLGEHRDSAYLILFLGSFLETLIPFSLMVPGELFFLSGALLAGMQALDLWAVVVLLYAGGLIGDNASYWLGRRYGSGLFGRLSGLPLLGRVVHEERYRAGEAFFDRHGPLAVFIARLSGPLSWVMPALAGTFGLRYRSFLLFNTLGIALGIGQFILVGYFFGHQIESILDWSQRHGVWIGALLMGCLLLVLVYRFRFARR